MIPFIKIFDNGLHPTDLTLGFYATHIDSDAGDLWPESPNSETSSLRALQRTMIKGSLLNLRRVRTEHSALHVGFCVINDMFLVWTSLKYRPSRAVIATLPHRSPAVITEIIEAARRIIASQQLLSDERFELHIYADWKDDDTLVMKKKQAGDDILRTIRAMQQLGVSHVSYTTEGSPNRCSDG